MKLTKKELDYIIVSLFPENFIHEQRGRFELILGKKNESKGVMLFVPTMLEAIIVKKHIKGSSVYFDLVQNEFVIITTNKYWVNKATVK